MLELSFIPIPQQICLKEEFELEKGDVLDSTYMSVKFKRFFN